MHRPVPYVVQGQSQRPRDCPRRGLSPRVARLPVSVILAEARIRSSIKDFEDDVERRFPLEPALDMIEGGNDIEPILSRMGFFTHYALHITQMRR